MPIRTLNRDQETRSTRRRRREDEPAVGAVTDARAASLGLRSSWLQTALRSVGLPAFLSCLALWAAFPPLGLSLLVWCAPLGLLWLIDREEAPGKRGYFWIWIAGCMFWLAILQGIRLAYWPLIFGWLALSLYLAVYLPLFVGIARVIRHRWKWSLVWSAPVAWTGLELCRSYLITGYPANTLAHTQYRTPLVIQAADQLGGYSISFVIVAVSVALYRTLQLLQPSVEADDARKSSKWFRARWDLAVPACLLASLLGYGYWRLEEGERLAAGAKPLLRAALIQENTPSQFESDPERLQQAWTRYASTTARAIREQGAVALVIWPESTFTAMIPWMEDDTIEGVPPLMVQHQFDRESLRRHVLNAQQDFKSKTRTLLDIIHGSLPPQSSVLPPTASQSTGQRFELTDSRHAPYLLVGNDICIYTDKDIELYNSALLIDPQGEIVSRYSKIHLVMFGEYIPLNWALGFLGDAFGLFSLTPGTDAQSFEVGGVRIAPSICFESMLPQMMAWQMRSLAAKKEAPDILVNITNDSWFHGSSILDHHLACNVLAAVEMRRPLLIAANTGLSAWIEGSGKIKQISPRLQAHYIIAECTRDSRWGLTQLWGDLPAWCLAGICALALLSGRSRRK